MSSLRRRLPLAVLLIGILVSALLWHALRRLEDSEARSAFFAAAQQRFDYLHASLARSLDSLESLGAFFEASERVDRSAFSRFTLDLLSRHAEIRALVWIPRVPVSRRAEFERAARAEGFASFQFIEGPAEGVLRRAGPRQEYFPAFFIEPRARAQRALGFDVSSSPARSEAMRIATDRGSLAATSRLIPLLDVPDYGLLVFHPLYRKGADLSDVPRRRAALQAFVLRVFCLREVVEKTGAGMPAVGRVRIAVFSPPALEGERLLYPREAP
jgi:CHASE1-domain containing sensor protein